MAEIAYGSVGVTDVFLAKADHTAIQKNDDTGAATALADRIIRLGDTSGDNLSEGVSLTPGEGSIGFTITHNNFSEDWTNFIDILLPRSTAAGSMVTTRSELTGESGRKIGGSAVAAGGNQAFVINYGAKTSTKCWVTCLLGGFTTNTGKIDLKNDWVKPTTEFKSTSCQKSGGLTIDKDLFDTTIVTVAADKTFPKDAFEYGFWATLA